MISPCIENISAETTEWFHKLRETTSEWNHSPGDSDNTRHERMIRNKLVYHTWENMGEELLALDRATRVPKDAPKVLLSLILSSSSSIPFIAMSILQVSFTIFKVNYSPKRKCSCSFHFI